jgi:hypothetical protein
MLHSKQLRSIKMKVDSSHGILCDHLVWAERRPGTGSSGDGTSHLLVLQQLDVEIAFARPSGAGDVAQPVE